MLIVSGWVNRNKERKNGNWNKDIKKRNEMDFNNQDRK